ncbi:MAG: hypothetical protein RPR91_11055 [Colwellia sp.]
MDEKFKQETISAEELASKLNNSSPLQASKILIETELFEKKSSLDVLDEIYDHFENKESLIDELVTPIGLNVLDGIISHKKLKLNRTGVTASRLWNEIKGFDYSTAGINAATLSDKQQLEGMRETREYNKEVRKEMTKRKNLDGNKEKHFGDSLTGESSIEVTGAGEKVEVYRYQKHAKSEGEKNRASDTDHVVPVKQINDRYAKNAFLTETDIAAITDADFNLIEISNELNRMKGAGSFQDLANRKGVLQQKRDSGVKLSAQEKRDVKKLEGISDETLNNGIECENESAENILSDAQGQAVENVKSNKTKIAKKAGLQSLEQAQYQALGTAMIEAFKPLIYELSDSIKNGFEAGVGVTDLMAAIKIRFARVMEHIKKKIVPMLADFVKNIFQNFAKILIEGILGLVTGIFKSIMRIISEGFSAIVSAVKILCTDSGAMSPTEKGDAIVKLLASTVTTFAVFYFSEHIVSAIPDEFIQDVCLAIMSGVASTLVVYLIDKLDLFSVKHEKRSKLVAEIFQERIATIKKNTDAFNASSVQELAAQKVAFKKLYEDFESGIDNDFDITNNVNSIADFMKIDLKILDTESFLDTLTREKVLVI